MFFKRILFDLFTVLGHLWKIDTAELGYHTAKILVVAKALLFLLMMHWWNFLLVKYVVSLSVQIVI